MATSKPDFAVQMWGERGLVATLFTDISAAGVSGWEEFFKACEFDRSLTENQAITGAWVLLRPRFLGQ